MPIYEARPEGIEPVAVTTFEAEGWRERSDIQRLLKDRIAVLEEGMLVLTDEFSGWADSARRIDLLCLDARANLVVVELKRGEDSGHMELQALRYAAMVSAMTFDQAAETLARYRNKAAPDLEAARAEILTHLRWTAPDEGTFAGEARVILASADFGRELTTTVLWLREYGLDIRCVRLRPHRMTDGRLLLDVQQLIPLPEAAEFQVRLEEKKAAERKERGERATLAGAFLAQLAERAAQRTELHRGRVPDAGLGVLFSPVGKAGFTINYVVARDSSRVELLVQRDDGRRQLLRLKEGREEIEVAFGGPLVWQEKEGVKQCRVYHPVAGGYRSPEPEWQRIQDEMIDAMIRLDHALRTRVQALA
ncbi:DUF4268 domain-containing protein [Dankookia rubra]|uniref:DUF4268 domain-containing protein n=1 Tax=Dankookia rubra TaxID=1442381 RepID=A0A4R5QEE6_9PROT|nr:DUF4268 domain-containing protein [Dankookia rubra]TDH61582.1 DUF4268 domain-containing protein [Dankookia rubra]